MIEKNQYSHAMIIAASLSKEVVQKVVKSTCLGPKLNLIIPYVTLNKLPNLFLIFFKKEYQKFII